MALDTGMKMIKTEKGNRSRTAGNQCSFCGTAGAGLQGSAGGRYEPLPYYL